jgi:uncharacterized RDD family membrane protein YckC
VQNFRRFKITEITEIRHNLSGEHDYSYREVQTVRGWQRLGHYVLDYIIIYGVSMLFQTFVWDFSPAPEELSGLTQEQLLLIQLKVVGIGLLQNFAFYAGFEGFFGSTPGKMLLGRVVIDEYGERPEFPRILLRTVCRWVPFEAISCLWPLGWHDKWSKTFVVTKDEADRLWDLLAKMEMEATQHEADRFRAQQS